MSSVSRLITDSTDTRGAEVSNAKRRMIKDFHPRADLLRQDFEACIAAARDMNAGVTPFVYAFSRNHYRFLTAGAERILSPESVEDFILKLRVWSGAQLEATHVSTPQLRLFIGGCSRALFCDQTGASWHYVFCLAPNHKARNRMRIRLLERPRPSNSHKRAAFERILSFELGFNDLFVHPTTDAYGIEAAGSAMDPCASAALFMDGYLW